MTLYHSIGNGVMFPAVLTLGAIKKLLLVHWEGNMSGCHNEPRAQSADYVHMPSTFPSTGFYHLRPQPA